MNKFTLKQKLILLVIFLGGFIIVLFQRGLSGNDTQSPQNEDQAIETQNQGNKPNEDGIPYLVSSSINSDGKTVILPTQVIEIVFSDPIENIGEFKHRFDPKPEYEAKLSNDRKTVIITPKPVFELGKSYTIFITNDTKFDGGKRLKDEISLRFKTIEYKGV